jgi:hypothetical protein
VDRTTFRAKRNGSGNGAALQGLELPADVAEQLNLFQGRRAFHNERLRERIRFRTYGQHSGTEKKGKMGVYDGCGF